MKRAMCVYLPSWPLQRLLHARPELRDRPVAMEQRHAPRLHGFGRVRRPENHEVRRYAQEKAELLDRLGDKNVTLTDANGKRIGTLPLGSGDPGNITGVFVDGNTVYVEEGHGGLTGIGTTDGQPIGSPVTTAVPAMTR